SFALSHSLFLNNSTTPQIYPLSLHDALPIRLRAAIQAARAENMPKDNIERAIKKSSDQGGENYDEVRYEGFGPGGIGVIVETLRSEEHTSELQSRENLVCRLLLEKKK